MKWLTTVMLMFVGSLALGGCMTDASTPAPVVAQSSSPPREQLTSVKKLEKSEIAAIEAGVRAGLKDPDSARFGKMVVGADSKGDYTVCLLVNAKNSYGGYTGEKPYIGMLFRDKKPYKFALVPFPEQHAQFRDEAAVKVCNDYGLPLFG